MYDAATRGLLSMTKAEIIAGAQPHVDHSFTEPTPGKSQHHTAWNTMKSLVEKGIIMKTGHPPKFSLTIAGQDLAEEVWTSRERMENQQQQQPVSLPSSTASIRTLAPVPNMIVSLAGHEKEFAKSLSKSSASTAHVPLAATRTTVDPLSSVLQSRGFGATQPQRAQAPTGSQKIANATQSVHQTPGEFQFWYLSCERTRVHAKDDAEIQISPDGTG
jgi:hypothetical protein